MPNIGPLELVIVLAIALIIFGPKRLPEMGRSLGRGIREFKNSVTSGDDDDDGKPEITSSRATQGEGGLHEPDQADEPERVEGEVVGRNPS